MSFFAGRDSPLLKSEMIMGDPSQHLVGDWTLLTSSPPSRPIPDGELLKTLWGVWEV